MPTVDHAQASRTPARTSAAAASRIGKVEPRRPIVSWEVAGKVLYQTLKGPIIELPEDMTVEQIATLEAEAMAAEKRLGKGPPPKPGPDVRKPAPKPAKTDLPKHRARGRRGDRGQPPPKAAEAAAALLSAVGTSKVAQYLVAKGAPVFARGASLLSRLKRNEQTHDDAGEKLTKSEDAVVIPPSEDQSKSNAGQVEVVGNRTAPVVDENKGKGELQDSLRANFPRSIEDVDNFKRDKKAQHTGADVFDVMQGDKNAVIRTFGDVRQTPPPEPATHRSIPLPPIEAAPGTAVLHLGQNAVAALQAEHTDTSAYVREADDKLKEEGITQEHLDMVDSGDLAEANKEKKGLQQTAKTEPLAVQKLAQQEAQAVDKDLAHEEKTGRESLHARRRTGLSATAHKQKDTQHSLERKRAEVAEKINNMYKAAQDSVTKKLADLEKDSMKRFDIGNAAAAKEFEDNVNREIDAFKDDRYSGWFGWARKARDWLLGIDDLKDVKKIFDDNREIFVSKVQKLVDGIAADNKRVIRECREELANARQKIQEFADKLEPGLKDIGKKAAGEMADKLGDLDKFINTKEEELKNKLKDKQVAAIRAIDQKTEKMKERLSGALAKFGRLLLRAAKKFFSWALEKVGLSLSTIENIIDKGTAVLKAIFTHPIEFAKNIGRAAMLGFKNFAKNFLVHLKDAVFSWLTGSLEGVVLPESWNLRGIMSVVFQLVGISWQHIKARLVLLIPARAVDELERGFELVKTLIAQGPIAAWEELKGMTSEIADAFQSAVSNWVKWRIIEEAIKTVALMLVPGAGFVRAVIAIYDIIVFFIQKAKEIIEMVGNFLGSITDIAAGNISSAADALEDGLVRGLKLVIDFLARLIHLKGVTDAIKKTIESIRSRIDPVIDRVANWVVAMAKKAGKLAVGATKATVGKLIEWWKETRSFRANGTTHTLYFQGEADKAKLYVRSSPPRPISEYLADLPSTAQDSHEFGKAVALALEIESKRPASETNIETYNARKLELYNQLAPLLMKLAGTHVLPPSIVTFKQMEPEVGGSEMEATILSKEHQAGTRPSETWPLWDTLHPLIEKSPYYVRGHLLNENLGGKGQMYNLTPITTKANADHKTQAETKVKNWVSAGKVVYYWVKADYGGRIKNKGDRQELLEAKPKYTLSPGETRELAALQAERKLARRIQYQAYIQRRQNGTWSKDPKAKGPDKPIADEIPNKG